MHSHKITSDNYQSWGKPLRFFPTHTQWGFNDRLPSLKIHARYSQDCHTHEGFSPHQASVGSFLPFVENVIFMRLNDAKYHALCRAVSSWEGSSRCQAVTMGFLVR